MKCIYNRVLVATAQVTTFIHSRALGDQHLHRVYRWGVSATRCYLNRAVCVALILSLLATSTPAAPQTIVALAKESTASFAFWFHASGWRKAASRLIENPGAKDKGQDKQRDRDAKVSRIQIFPGDVTVDLGDHVRFAAVAYDRDGIPVGGVKIKWSGQSSVPGGRVRISQHGEFEATTPGTFNIVAEGAGKTAAVAIVVHLGLRRNLNLAPTKIRQVSTRDLPSTSTTKIDNSNESVAQNSKKGASKTKGSKMCATRRNMGTAHSRARLCITTTI